jgi:chemotaxis protein CheD
VFKIRSRRAFILRTFRIYFAAQSALATNSTYRIQKEIVEHLYLYPGEIFAGLQPRIVDTILGSCVAVALFDEAKRRGSINHFMLPEWNKEGKPSNKYGDIAIPEIIQKMLVMGSYKSDLKAKIFGGSEIGNFNGVFNIGERNILQAREILRHEQIPIVSFSVGGKRGRKVIFNSSTGEVLIRFLKGDINVGDATGSKTIRK